MQKAANCSDSLVLSRFSTAAAFPSFLILGIRQHLVHECLIGLHLNVFQSAHQVHMEGRSPEGGEWKRGRSNHDERKFTKCLFALGNDTNEFSELQQLKAFCVTRV